jgi:hypothetical protein
MQLQIPLRGSGRVSATAEPGSPGHVVILSGQSVCFRVLPISHEE